MRKVQLVHKDPKAFKEFRVQPELRGLKAFRVQLVPKV